MLLGILPDDRTTELNRCNKLTSMPQIQASVQDEIARLNDTRLARVYEQRRKQPLGGKHESYAAVVVQGKGAVEDLKQTLVAAIAAAIPPEGKGRGRGTDKARPGSGASSPRSTSPGSMARFNGCWHCGKPNCMRQKCPQVFALKQKTAACKRQATTVHTNAGAMHAGQQPMTSRQQQARHLLFSEIKRNPKATTLRAAMSAVSSMEGILTSLQLSLTRSMLSRREHLTAITSSQGFAAPPLTSEMHLPKPHGACQRDSVRTHRQTKRCAQAMADIESGDTVLPSIEDNARWGILNSGSTITAADNAKEFYYADLNAAMALANVVQPRVRNLVLLDMLMSNTEQRLATARK